MRTPEWRYWIDPAGRPGWANMAIDRTLLDLAAGEGSAILRLYRWTPFTLSFGCHEPAARRYDRQRIAREGIACVRRPTGGRAVWHARELTYAVAAPTAWFGNLRDAYRAIHAVVRDAVTRLGLQGASLAGDPDAPLGLGAGACFAGAVGGEVMHAGRKLAGSAQLRAGPALLQHGSLLLEDDQALVRSLAGSGDARTEIPLHEALGRPVPFEAAAGALLETAQEAWAGTWTVVDTDGVLAGSAEHAPRFKDPAWTWRR